MSIYIINTEPERYFEEEDLTDPNGFHGEDLEEVFQRFCDFCCFDLDKLLNIESIILVNDQGKIITYLSSDEINTYNYRAFKAFKNRSNDCFRREDIMEDFQRQVFND